MSDALDDILTKAIRTARDSAFSAAIELCGVIAEGGGCATCCVEQLTKLQNELHAGDLTADVIAKVSQR